MEVSVVIPTYNSAATIRQTIDSVLGQTFSPDEVLVFDDGSTDETVQIVRSYESSIKIIEGKHEGVANARNALCALARGERIAFLDHDDIWHPSYLEVQYKVSRDYPQAVAFFTGHLDFFGYGNYQWVKTPIDIGANAKLISPLDFFKWYNRNTGPFSSMSYCCIPRAALKRMGSQPFCISGVDDSYLCNILALLGPVVYNPMPLVAYRITMEAQSTNKLKAYGLWVEVFKILQEPFRNQEDRRLYRAFRIAFASKSRQYAKSLMGVGRTFDARRELWRSLKSSNSPVSISKSLALLLLTGMPTRLQLKWPSSYREFHRSDIESKSD